MSENTGVCRWCGRGIYLNNNGIETYWLHENGWGQCSPKTAEPWTEGLSDPDAEAAWRRLENPAANPLTFALGFNAGYDLGKSAGWDACLAQLEREDIIEAARFALVEATYADVPVEVALDDVSEVDSREIAAAVVSAVVRVLAEGTQT